MQQALIILAGITNFKQSLLMLDVATTMLAMAAKQINMLNL